MKFNKINEAFANCYDGIKDVASNVKDKTSEYAGKVAEIAVETAKIGKEKVAVYAGKVENYLKTPKGKVAMTAVAAALFGIGATWIVGSLVASAAAVTTAKLIIGGMVLLGLLGSGIGTLACGIAGIGGSIATGGLLGTIGLSKFVFGSIIGAGLFAPIGGVFGSLLAVSASTAVTMPLAPIVAGVAFAIVAGYLASYLLGKLDAEEDLIEEGYMGA